MNKNTLRNIAIIAHVDHGKTTLVDRLLQQSGTLDRKNMTTDRIMDSNDQEKERGITILAKNTAINWKGHRINIIDTPGHADFGGEVERVLSMVDSVLLLVDAVDGPMPQTRFVTQKAFELGLKPILVVNKVDRPEARPHWVLDQVFELFDNLGASDEQLDFNIIYASALNGLAGLEADELAEDMTPLLDMIVDKVSAPDVDEKAPFRMQISALDSNSYVGVIGIGRITGGSVRPNQRIVVVDKDLNERKAKILQVLGHHGLERVEIEEAKAGDIVCITGVEALNISDTLCDPEHINPMPPLSVDEPTVSMVFQVNDSPFCGQEGKYVTSRNIKDRLEQELVHNVALRVEDGETADKFKVSGRGELHLSVLIETMRRENYELAVSKPQVIQREVDGEIHEPFEIVVIDIEQQHQGAIMEEMGNRKADLQSIVMTENGRMKLDFMAPSRGMIGFRSSFLTLTSGSGILTSIFDHYGPAKKGEIAKRKNGVMYSMTAGKTLAYGLFNLQNRGRMFVGHGLDVYKGQIVGLHARDNDLPVNPTKAKQLTNIRAAGTDENLILTPHIVHTLEQALEFIEDDELVEVTPKSIRLRKKVIR
ncbi:MAG: GTP-binding protein TypA [SAR86 cluster bacterium BACL1 MAG-121105-bin34]|uniref:Large ribosomal subunit assembly factor BipA n=2 Tax=SAR86 cluster TaxID=62672 RepID=A0A0R2UEC8_9GAMM|nr:MAG: GTP-binding protein TypA [SAR86 cluster bacterium BACL1 MAG-120507-bin14]KRO40524.1 MAG: GTP-binding protein TypA [SAR86 cluster bacterium BACL1 MAG-120920-bin57]KRO95699.1 MAG: GTP-binding protein TypA [SAR86 cluster bacterium BACL1 MAG-120820-bin45]KRO97156.1 MAG: GTP-binding protein TypA [SAR86 cluster bacterium BACL1 MAG-120828-bin5]KRO98340.1 MAG: GTP-binding protein TypA [SAR86 cluster bacterium BACL1 MAG-120823-bin87]KRP00064.1 MAG: GTP-binding protein TypA [SAR86 cluster bacter